MFKAMLEMSIRKSVIRPDGTRVSRLVHIVEKEVELPFVPVKGCLFYDFGDELQVEWVHYDLQDQRFDIDCGGMLLWVSMFAHEYIAGE
jgi:hypothetical protein